MRTFLNFFPQSLWTKLHALMFYLKSPREPKYAFYCIKKNGNFRKVCSRFNPRSLRRVFSVHFFLREFSIAGIFIQLWNTQNFLKSISGRLSVEKNFSIHIGYSAHIDVSGAQKRNIAMPHIQLQAGQVFKSLCMVACVSVAQNILDPYVFESWVVSNFPPFFIPVARADGRGRNRIKLHKNAFKRRAYLDLPNPSSFRTLGAHSNGFFRKVYIAPCNAAHLTRADACKN